MRVLVLLLALGISGCNPKTIVKIQCPPLKVYTAEEQKQISQEMRVELKDTFLAQVSTDYYQLRSTCRRINSGK